MGKVPVPQNLAKEIMIKLHKKITDGTATADDYALAEDMGKQTVCDVCPLPAVDIPRDKLISILKNQLGERDYYKMQFDFATAIGDDFNYVLDILYGSLNIPTMNPGVGLGKIKDAIRAIEALAPADYWIKGELRPLS